MGQSHQKYQVLLTLVRMLLCRGLFNNVETPCNRFMNSRKKSCPLGGLLLGQPGPPGPLGPPGPPGPLGAARSSGFILAAWLGVIIFITLVALVCCMSRGIGFHFWNLRIPWQPIAPCWMWIEVLGCVGPGPPGICQIYRSPVV